jgi:hypothetical protein
MAFSFNIIFIIKWTYLINFSKISTSSIRWLMGIDVHVDFFSRPSYWSLGSHRSSKLTIQFIGMGCLAPKEVTFVFFWIASKREWLLLSIRLLFYIIKNLLKNIVFHLSLFAINAIFWYLSFFKIIEHKTETPLGSSPFANGVPRNDNLITSPVSSYGKEEAKVVFDNPLKFLFTKANF